MVTAKSARKEKSAISVLRASKTSQILYISVSSSEPRTPHPNQDVGNDSDSRKSEEARHEDLVKGLSLILREYGVIHDVLQW